MNDTSPSQKLYQIYDLVAQTVIGPIINANNAAPAIRHFHDILKDETSLLHAHPQDYNLLELGRQYSEGGTIAANDPPITIATGASWLEQAMRKGETSLSKLATDTPDVTR